MALKIQKKKKPTYFHATLSARMKRAVCACRPCKLLKRESFPLSHERVCRFLNFGAPFFSSTLRELSIVDVRISHFLTRVAWVLRVIFLLEFICINFFLFHRATSKRSRYLEVEKYSRDRNNSRRSTPFLDKKALTLRNKIFSCSTCSHRYIVFVGRFGYAS